MVYPPHYHLIGIGGSGMQGLARILRALGYQVSGCDLKLGEFSDTLSRDHVRIVQGHHKCHVEAPLTAVVASPAIEANNPEIVEAIARNIPVYRYPEMLAQVMTMKKPVAVAGTHGKSTTTGLLAYTLQQADMDPSYVVGATVPQLASSSHWGKGEYFVVEACEYRRSFLNYSPEHAIITAIELDHLDCYRDLQDIAQTFSEFARKIPATGTLIAGKAAAALLSKDLPCPVATYSKDEAADWQATDMVRLAWGHRFTVSCRGKQVGEFVTHLPGAHNVANALSVIAMCHYLGVSYEKIAMSVENYQGVARRFEILRREPVTIVSDYAHHPSKNKAVLQAARDSFGKAKIWCVFQPHQANRTRHLFNDFADSFAAADEVIISDIFFARDSEEDRRSVNSRELAAAVEMRGKPAHYLAAFAEISDYLKKNWRPGDVVMVLGAGNIDDLARQLAKETILL
jgi:UDP-N-acetylmuramate--alanine ligase